MSYLLRLQQAQTRKDLATILGVQAKALSFILHKIPSSEKYHTFGISKRNGGMREINAPEPRLKMLQKKLATILYWCVDEIYENPPKGLYSHAYLKSRSTFTNAWKHKNRRYVLNLDIKDFFPSINFGRVRGYFIKHKSFNLQELTATVIAQIACHNNQLPQGSPCSPIISNLIAHILDVRLVRFAQKHKCTYSRYADDITFSTNQSQFPSALAEQSTTHRHGWELGKNLTEEIQRAGFEVNTEKTKMQYRGSRQETTGLIVNKKVNVKSEYFKRTRAMCHSLFTTGEYHLSDSENPINDLNRLEGILGHIYHIKNQTDIRLSDKDNLNSSSIRKLYRRFLFYKHFVVNDKPVVLTEGKTDPLYLHIAIRKLKRFHPQLGEFHDKKFVGTLRFLKHTETMYEILKSTGGVTKILDFAMSYQEEISNFEFRQLSNPVIVLIDNDGDTHKIFGALNQKYKLDVSFKSKHSFYHINTNLYLVKTPEQGPDCKSNIEDLLDPKLLDVSLAGRKFDPQNKSSSDSTFGKVIFAKQVVIPNADSSDFTRFEVLLDRFVAVLVHYRTHKYENLIENQNAVQTDD